MAYPRLRADFNATNVVDPARGAMQAVSDVASMVRGMEQTDLERKKREDALAQRAAEEQRWQAGFELQKIADQRAAEKMKLDAEKAQWDRENALARISQQDAQMYDENAWKEKQYGLEERKLAQDEKVRNAQIAKYNAELGQIGMENKSHDFMVDILAAKTPDEARELVKSAKAQGVAFTGTQYGYLADKLNPNTKGLTGSVTMYNTETGAYGNFPRDVAAGLQSQGWEMGRLPTDKDGNSKTTSKVPKSALVSANEKAINTIKSATEARWNPFNSADAPTVDLLASTGDDLVALTGMKAEEAATLLSRTVDQGVLADGSFDPERFKSLLNDKTVRRAVVDPTTNQTRFVDVPMGDMLAIGQTRDAKGNKQFVLARDKKGGTYYEPNPKFDSKTAQKNILYGGENPYEDVANESEWWQRWSPGGRIDKAVEDYLQKRANQQ